MKGEAKDIYQKSLSAGIAERLFLILKL